jgi:iron complex outermembrane recepter protein
MGAYAQHLMKWKKLQVLLGLRYDKYEVPLSSWEFKGRDITVPDVQSNFTQNWISLFRLLPTTNVYATFNQGYMPVDPWTNSTPSTGGPFLPMYSQLMEEV